MLWAQTTLTCKESLKSQRNKEIQRELKVVFNDGFLDEKVDQDLDNILDTYITKKSSYTYSKYPYYDVYTRKVIMDTALEDLDPASSEYYKTRRDTEVVSDHFYTLLKGLAQKRYPNVGFDMNAKIGFIELSKMGRRTKNSNLTDEFIIFFKFAYNNNISTAFKIHVHEGFFENITQIFEKRSSNDYVKLGYTVEDYIKAMVEETKVVSCR